MKVKTHLFSCSGCRKPLLELVVRPIPIKPHQIRAQCPYCGDFSFPEEVDGKYQMVGYGVVDEKHLDGFRDVTKMAGFSRDGDVLTIKVVQCEVLQ